MIGDFFSFNTWGCQRQIAMQLQFPARLQSLCPSRMAKLSHKGFSPKQGSPSARSNVL